MRVENLTAIKISYQLSSCTLEKNSNVGEDQSRITLTYFLFQ